jgi:hypothetical protein
MASGSAAATNRLRLREKVSGSSWGWGLKLREDTVSGGAYRTTGNCSSGQARQSSEGAKHAVAVVGWKSSGVRNPGLTLISGRGCQMATPGSLRPGECCCLWGPQERGLTPNGVAPEMSQFKRALTIISHLFPGHT